MLAAAIIVPPAAFFWLVAMQPGMIGPMFIARPGPNLADVTMAVGVGLWFAGVIWMIRIFRGPSDVPPLWRYRDRRAGSKAPVRRQ